jgi:hypothetical protein
LLTIAMFDHRHFEIHEMVISCVKNVILICTINNRLLGFLMMEQWISNRDSS